MLSNNTKCLTDSPKLQKRVPKGINEAKRIKMLRIEGNSGERKMSFHLIKNFSIFL
jgi:hypothetical protein